jgi:pyridoxal phosphate enzyme (YggS family)
MATIIENLNNIKKSIAEASQKAGISKDIRIVASTKGVSADSIKEAIQAGITDIGENRVQEAAEKYPALSGQPVTWHMIGHLQTNKVKQALEIFSVIQSVDSLKLAKEISRLAKNSIKIFIEVNTSGEESKYGVAPDKAIELAREVSSLPNITIAGLMTIGPNTGMEEDIRMSFRMLKGIFKSIKELNLPSIQLEYLSMGMSSDYRLAVEEGSNMVRIGRAIFGK